MRRVPCLSGGMILMLTAACTPPPGPGALPDPAPVPATLIDSADFTIGPDGRCFTGRILTPAVMETVTEQVLVLPAQTDADGMVTSPAVYRNEEVERVAVPAERDAFETLCPPAFTPAFISSLQRALAARNAYAGPINGVYDRHTGEAVRLYQITDGPNSQIIALETAQELGLAALTPTQIEALGTEP